MCKNSLFLYFSKNDTMKVSSLPFLSDIVQIKIWDAQEKKCTGVLMGHTGSVKCLSSHPTNCGRFLENLCFFFPCSERAGFLPLVFQQILLSLVQETGPLPSGI